MCLEKLIITSTCNLTLNLQLQASKQPGELTNSPSFSFHCRASAKYILREKQHEKYFKWCLLSSKKYRVSSNDEPFTTLAAS